MRRIGHVLLPVLLLVGFVGAAYGEMALPGTYHGYYAETRWGQKVFHVGPYHLGLSDEAAARLTPHRGRPLAVKVSKFIQLMNPGPATMEKIDDVAVKGVADGLTLAAKTAAAKALQGQGLVLHLTVRNSSQTPVSFLPEPLAVVIVANAASAKEPADYRDPNGCAYWYYGHGGGVECHEVSMPWTAKDFTEKGHKIRMAEGDKGRTGFVTVEPGGEFQADWTIGKELPPGEYEAFFYLSTGNFSYAAGPMSERLSFDVLAGKDPR